VKMPFERLMELVSSLSDEDAKLPMGVLAERRGEPVSRIGDAIDAVRVLNGEHTYISLGPDLLMRVQVDGRMPPGRVALAGRGPDGEPAVAVMENVGTGEPGKPVCPKCGMPGCLEDKALDW
jgi:hypothetical protein